MSQETPPTADPPAGPAMSMSHDSISSLLQPGVVGPPPRPGVLGSLDNYEIIRLIGAGGMALVFLARDAGSGRQVAIKVLRPELAAQPQGVHRFLKEARHMQQLGHAGVVQVMEVRERPQGPYFVMDYLEGGSLARRLTPGEPLDERTALHIAWDVAEALSHAHARGIFHRDLKPGNIMLDGRGRALLTDFGLVHTVYNDSIIDASRAHFEGTPAYASPEVCRGEAGDARCDIYGFGATLYEMLTGQPPYDGRTAQEIISKVQAGPPAPIAGINPEASRLLTKITEGAMARELRDRYASMADVVADLKRVQEGKEPVGPHGKASRWRAGWGVGRGVRQGLSPRSRLVALLVVAVLLGGVRLGMFLWGDLAGLPPGMPPPSGSSAGRQFHESTGGGTGGIAGNVLAGMIDKNDPSGIDTKRWRPTTTASRAAGAPGTGASKVSAGDGVVLIQAACHHERGFTREQAACVESLIDLKRIGNGREDEAVLVEVEYSGEAENGAAVFSLAEGRPLTAGGNDPAQIVLVRLEGGVNKKLEWPRQRMTIQLSPHEKLAVLKTGQGDEALVDLSRLTYWKLRLSVFAGSSYGYDNAEARLRIHDIRAISYHCDASVVGRVVDALTGRPIAGAQVRTSQGKTNTSTRSNGMYKLDTGPGEHMIQISADRYGSQAMRVDVGDDRFSRRDVTLRKPSVEYGDVVWSVPFEPWHDGINSLLVRDGRLFYTSLEQVAGNPAKRVAWLLSPKLNADRSAMVGFDRLVKLDDPRGSIGAPNDTAVSGTGIADCNGEIYLLHCWPGRLFRIDLSKGADAPTAVIPVYETTTDWPHGLAFDGTHLWFFECPADSVTLRRMKLVGFQEIDSVPSSEKGRRYSAVAYSLGHLWLGTGDSVYEVDPAAALAKRSIEGGILRSFRGGYSSLCFSDGYLWGIDNETRRICQINVEATHATTNPAPTTSP